MTPLYLDKDKSNKDVFYAIFLQLSANARQNFQCYV